MDVSDGLKKYGITWVDSKLYRIADETGREVKSRTNIFFGVCHRTKRICKVSSNPIEYLMVNDFHFGYDPSEDKSGPICEEGTRCLDFGCEHNKSTVEDVAAMIGYANKIPKRIRERIEGWIAVKSIPFVDMDLSEHVDEGGYGRIVTGIKGRKYD